jgi:hypothetical protein
MSEKRRMNNLTSALNYIPGFERNYIASKNCTFVKLIKLRKFRKNKIMRLWWKRKLNSNKLKKKMEYRCAHTYVKGFRL